jgi:hypothetical protein
VRPPGEIVAAAARAAVVGLLGVRLLGVRLLGVGLLGVALLAGGCGMDGSDGGSTGGSTSGGATRTGGPVHGDAVRLDLRRPPSASELGVAAGQSTVSFRRRPGHTLDVDITLPDDGRLHVPAIAYDAVLAPTVAGSAQGNQVIVNRVEPSLDAGQAALVDDAAGLGFDAAEIRAFVAQVRRTDLTTYGPMNRVFVGRRFGYLDPINADLRVEPDKATVLINYELDWPARATASASP